jgi:hypothetical protein
MLSQREKIETLLADQRQRNAQRNKDATTFSQFGASEAKEIEGRFSAREKASVIGSTQAPQYPAGPNWAADPVGVEPTLGFSVEDHEPVGEYAEIEKSLGDPAASGIARRAARLPWT